MALETQEGLIQRQGVINSMIDKILVVTIYAIPTIALLIVCYLISKQK